MFIKSDRFVHQKEDLFTLVSLKPGLTRTKVLHILGLVVGGWFFVLFYLYRRSNYQRLTLRFTNS